MGFTNKFNHSYFLLVSDQMFFYLFQLMKMNKFFISVLVDIIISSMCVHVHACVREVFGYGMFSLYMICSA